MSWNLRRLILNDRRSRTCSSDGRAFQAHEKRQRVVINHLKVRQRSLHGDRAPARVTTQHGLVEGLNPAKERQNEDRQPTNQPTWEIRSTWQPVCGSHPTTSRPRCWRGSWRPWATWSDPDHAWKIPLFRQSPELQKLSFSAPLELKLLILVNQNGLLWCFLCIAVRHSQQGSIWHWW